MTVLIPDTPPVIPVGVMTAGEVIRQAGWIEILARQGWAHASSGCLIASRHFDPAEENRDGEWGVGDQGELAGDAYLVNPSRREVDGYDDDGLGAGWYLVEVSVFVENCDVRIRPFDQEYGSAIDRDGEPLTLEILGPGTGWYSGYFLVSPALDSFRIEPEMRGHDSNTGHLHAICIREWRQMSPDTYRAQVKAYGGPIASIEPDGEGIEYWSTEDRFGDFDRFDSAPAPVPNPVLNRVELRYGIHSVVTATPAFFSPMRTANSHDLSAGGVLACTASVKFTGGHIAEVFDSDAVSIRLEGGDIIAEVDLDDGGAEQVIQLVGAYTSGAWVDIVLWWDSTMERIHLWVDGEHHFVDGTKQPLAGDPEQNYVLGRLTGGEVDSLSVAMPMVMTVENIDRWDVERIVAWRRSMLGTY